jgi:hypothetical protein
MANKYGTKWSPERSAASVALTIQSTIFNQARQADERRRLNAALKVLLGAEAVSSGKMCGYLAFAYQVASLKAKLNGVQLISGVQNLLELWVAQGLTESTLGKIRDNLFTIPAPPGP